MRSAYIHIPFCNSICSYCDFCKYLNNDEWASKYIESLKKEIEEYYEDDIVKTIYVGGGTPSSLNEKNLISLFEVLNKIKRKDNCEFTFECNINDINERFLRILNLNNVNRLSIGVESFDKDNLKLLNRKHDKKDIEDKINLCKQYNFDNINIDLIYALPKENMHTLKSDINKYLKLDVDHISTYSLIIEEHTVLFNKKVKNIEEELDEKMYKYICKTLNKKKYKHYEVSNFARNDKVSKHNLTYWNNNEYYGFGAGAHGYINNMRYENTRSLNKYLDGQYRISELLVSTQEEMENQIMLGLRKLDGISINEFEKRFNRSIFDVFKLDEVLEKGYLVKDGDSLFIPEDKIYVMNEIINMIM